MKAIAKKAKIRVGIALGWEIRVATATFLSWSFLPNFKVVAVASRRKEYAQETVKQFRDAYAFMDANKLINDRVFAT